MIKSHKTQYSNLISCKAAIRLHYSSFRAATLMLCYTEWASAQTAVNENVSGPSPSRHCDKAHCKQEWTQIQLYSHHEYCHEWRDNWVDKFSISAPCVPSWSNLSEWVKLSGNNLLASHEQDFYQLAVRQTGLLCNASNEFSSLDSNLINTTFTICRIDTLLSNYWTSGGWALCPIHISIRQRGHFRTELSAIKGDSTPDPNVSHKSN